MESYSQFLEKSGTCTCHKINDFIKGACGPMEICTGAAFNPRPDFGHIDLQCKDLKIIKLKIK